MFHPPSVAKLLASPVLGSNIILSTLFSMTTVKPRYSTTVCLPQFVMVCWGCWQTEIWYRREFLFTYFYWPSAKVVHYWGMTVHSCFLRSSSIPGILAYWYQPHAHFVKSHQTFRSWHTWHCAMLPRFESPVYTKNGSKPCTYRMAKSVIQVLLTHSNVPGLCTTVESVYIIVWYLHSLFIYHSFVCTGNELQNGPVGRMGKM